MWDAICCVELRLSLVKHFKDVFSNKSFNTNRQYLYIGIYIVIVIDIYGYIDAVY